MRRHAITELEPRWVSAGDLRYGVGIRLLKCPFGHEGCQIFLLFKHPNDGMGALPRPGAKLYEHHGGMLDELSISELIHHREGIIAIWRGRVYAWRRDDG